MLKKMVQTLRRFQRDERGSAGAEFVVSLPLLIGVMVIASEYGGALQVRDVLDAATRDAARFLARAPLDSSGNYRQHFVDEAEGLVAERLGLDAAQVELITTEPPGADGSRGAASTGPTVIDDTDGEFRTEYRVVTVDVEIVYEMPLLALLDMGKSASIKDVERTETPGGRDALRIERNDGYTQTVTAIRMVARDTARYTGEVPDDETTACNWVMVHHGDC